MKRLILLAVMASVTTFAGAQMKFGAKAGLNLASIHVSPKEEGTSFKLNPSVNVAAMAGIPLSKKLSLQPEVMFSIQGAKMTEQGSTDKITNQLAYLNVPVLLKYNDPSGFFAEVGPQMGFLLSAKMKSQGISADAKSIFNSTDFAGTFGVGYLFPFHVGIDARYNMGFSNIAKTDGDNNGTKAKNNVGQFSIFYQFGKSK